MTSRIAIVIVHYHTPHLLTRAVDALRLDLASSGLSAHIIVVDNGSNSPNWEWTDSADVTVLAPGKNLGYAGGVNLGVAHSDADIFVLMNPDVEVFPGCLSALINEIDRGTPVVGPRLYWDETRKILLPPREENTRRFTLLAYLGSFSERAARQARRQWRRLAAKHWLASEPVQSYALSGSILAVHSSAWDAVGPFDSGFMMYFEETDWFERLKREGLQAAYVPQATAWHRYAQSTVNEPQSERWFRDSDRRFQDRYYGAWFRLFMSLMPENGGYRQAVFQQAGTCPEIELPAPAANPIFPLQVEISPSPSGIPAGAALVTDRTQTTWLFPEQVWNGAAPGTYYIRVVDQSDAEVGARCTTKTSSS